MGQGEASARHGILSLGVCPAGSVAVIISLKNISFQWLLLEQRSGNLNGMEIECVVFLFCFGVTLGSAPGSGLGSLLGPNTKLLHAKVDCDPGITQFDVRLLVDFQFLYRLLFV